MIEHIFEDMEYIRMFDFLADYYRDDDFTIDPDELADKLYIPRIKVDTILERFENLNIIKRGDDNFSLTLNSDSIIVQKLLDADMEACCININKFKDDEQKEIVSKNSYFVYDNNGEIAGYICAGCRKMKDKNKHILSDGWDISEADLKCRECSNI